MFRPSLAILVALSLPSAVPAEELPSVNYDRGRDGTMMESLAMRDFVAASNAYAKAASYGPVGAQGEGNGVTTWRLEWAAPPARLVLERTEASDGRPMALRAFSEPLRAVSPCGPEHPEPGVAVLRVPMFRQETRDACAPATMASLLVHCGIPCLPSQLEEDAAAEAEGGTDLQGLVVRVRDGILPGTGLVLREHLGFGTDRFLRILRTYNRRAEEMPDVKRLYWKPPDIHLDRAFSRADPALLRDVANRQPERRRFWRAVRRSVDAGRPLLWGVVLGVVGEPGLPASQPRAGHLRLIVGYREEPRAILFSDPWGPAHAAKELPLEDAWTETMTLHTLEPR